MNRMRCALYLAAMALTVAAWMAACGAGEVEKPKLVNLGSIRVYVQEKRIEIDGEIKLGPGIMIEVFACTPTGKTHETVMIVDAMPSNVHAALLLIGLKPGKPVAFQGEDRMPTGDPVKMSVRWKDGDKTKTVRAEDLLLNVRDKRPMKPQTWVFCGSAMDPQSPKPYLADMVGNIIVTYHDAATVIDSPGEGGADDEVLEVNGKTCPPVKTPVTLIIEPAPK
jgi:hypothetical protein